MRYTFFAGAIKLSLNVVMFNMLSNSNIAKMQGMKTFKPHLTPPLYAWIGEYILLLVHTLHFTQKATFLRPPFRAIYVYLIKRSQLYFRLKNRTSATFVCIVVPYVYERVVQKQNKNKIFVFSSGILAIGLL